MKYKIQKSVAHNFSHSFVSYMDDRGKEHVCEVRFS